MRSIERSSLPDLLDRRALLRGATALITLADLGAPRLARADSASRVLKMGYVLSRESQQGAATAEFARQVEAGTSGAWRIAENPNGALGGEAEMLDGLRRGELDLSWRGGTGSFCRSCLGRRAGVA